MALTNEEKSYMRSEIKAYIRDGVTKKEAKNDLVGEGFNSRTVDKYWKVFTRR